MLFRVELKLLIHTQGDPNIDINILEALLWGPPKWDR